MTTTLGNSYDEVPYPGHAYAQSHPNHLAALATLLALQPPPIDRCRVLELGAAAGGNLIPMASVFPESDFIGVDLSVQQVDTGNETIAALGLRNVRLLHLDLLEIDQAFGEFDYIIAHGVYSWVPAHVRDHVLRICKQNLAPNGVAYVSYNTYPGWHILGAIRDMMLYRTADEPNPQERAAKAMDLLEFMAQSWEEDRSLFGSFLSTSAGYFKEHLDQLGAMRDPFLLHDALEVVNDPVYFADFMRHAAQHGLQYLAEAEFPMVTPRGLPQQAVERIRKMSRSGIDLEQYMDFLRGRQFRQTLLCHQEAPIDRMLKPDRLSRLYVSTQALPVSAEPDLHPGVVERFRSADGATLSIDLALSKAAMLHLGSVWPQAVAFTTLLDVARARLAEEDIPIKMEPAREAQLLGGDLLKAFCYSASLIELHALPPAVANQLAERPAAFEPARLLAASEAAEVTNLHHGNVALDPLARTVVGLLDGTHDREAVLKELERLHGSGALVLPEQEDETEEQPLDLEKALDETLGFLLKSALLVA